MFNLAYISIFNFIVHGFVLLWRIGLVLTILVLISSSSGLRDVVLQSMGDAFLQVTVFVGATLAIVYMFESVFGFDLGKLLGRFYHLQPFFSAVLGALPGCGGAIIVITQFTRGYITFGSMVAVLVATMGDAAFLLLARDFLTGVAVIFIGIIVGSLVGMIVDIIHGPLFMKPHVSSSPEVHEEDAVVTSSYSLFRREWLQVLWIVMMSIGLFFGIMLQFQVDLDGLSIFSITYENVEWLGILGMVLSLGMLISSRVVNTQVMSSRPTGCSPYTLTERVIIDTNFVTSWVLVGFLIYDLTIYTLGKDVADLFGGLEVFAPLLAICIGFLPGCGPQIVVTSLYLNGALPFSAQLGNAIANDGDALFPALALTPHAAILATVYSAIPAFILAYGYYFLFE